MRSRITIPLIMPTILFITMTQFIAHMQVFARPYIIALGGPGTEIKSTNSFLNWKPVRKKLGRSLMLWLIFLPPSL